MKDFDINKIADLAMLALNEDELCALQKDMEDIVSFAERISEVGSLGFEEQVSNSPLREDEVKASLSLEEALSSAPEKRGSCFFVPQVVE